MVHITNTVNTANEQESMSNCVMVPVVVTFTDLYTSRDVCERQLNFLF